VGQGVAGDVRNVLVGQGTDRFLSPPVGHRQARVAQDPQVL